MSDASPSLDEIYCNALKREGAARREYLDEVCGGDLRLRERVLQLLQLMPAADSFWAHAEGASTISPPPPTSEEPATLAAGSVVGHYRIRQKIGEGGMGVIYRAHQEEPIHRDVALKVIKPGIDTRRVVVRFEAERQALAMMDHSAIARVFDAGATAEGRPYFAMELVHGAEITRFSQRRQLNLNDRLRLMIDVCRGVEHAHQKGIIHRDLKPSNILVTNVEGAPAPKIIDFGIAKAMETPLTEHTLFTQAYEALGTLSYMSPEQSRPLASDVDTRSDVYSLGVILYELLTGQPPFSGEQLRKAGLDEARRIICNQTPVRPSARRHATCPLPDSRSTDDSPEQRELSQRIRLELDWVVMKALAKERARRYQSASELASDLQRFLDHEPVEARPPSLSYRLSKLIRRHRALVLTTTFVVLALIAATAFSVWQAGIAIAAQKQADSLLEVANSARRDADRFNAQLERQLYATNMTLAQQALQQGNIAEATRLLDRQMPGPGAPDLRQLEWFLMDQWLRPAALWNTQLGGPVQEIAFSPDFTVIASAGGDGVLNLVAADDGRRLCRIIGFEDCMSLDWHQSNRLAACDSDGLVRVWNRETLEELTRDRATEREMHPDDRPPATDVSTANLVFQAHELTIRDLVFTPDGQFLVTGSEDSLIRIWDAATGQPSDELVGHEKGVYRLAVSPDGRFLASAAADETARTWRLSDGSQLQTWKWPRSPGRMTAVTFSRDGTVLAMGNNNGTILVGHSETEELLAADLADAALDITFNIPGSQLLVADAGGNVTYWTVERESRLSILRDRQVLPGWQAAPTRVQALASDLLRHRIVTGSRGGVLSCWPARQTQPGELFSPGALMAFVDSETVLTGIYAIELRELRSGRVLRSFLPSHEKWKCTSRVRRGGIVAFATEHDVVLYDLNRHEELYRWQSDDMICDIALAPAANVLTISVRGEPQQLRIVRFNDDYLVESVKSFRVESVGQASFSPNGKVLAVAAMDDVLLLEKGDSGWTGSPFVTDHDSSLSKAAFSPDGQNFATVSADRSMKIWRTDSSLASDHIRVHDKSVLDVEWLPGGERIATTSRDRRLKLWDRSSLQPVLVVPLSAEGYRVRVSPDGRTILCATGDGVCVLRHEDRRKADSPTRTLDALFSESGAEFQVLVPNIVSGTHGPEVSDDGTVAAGDRSPHGGSFFWSSSSGLEPCRLPPPEFKSIGSSLSPDGTQLTATIWQDKTRRVPARWKAGDSHSVLLEPPEGWHTQFVQDISGEQIVGFGKRGANGSSFIPWYRDAATFCELPLPDDCDQGVAECCLRDSRDVIGFAWSGPGDPDGSVSRDVRVVRWRNELPVALPGGSVFGRNIRPTDAACGGNVIVGYEWPAGRHSIYFGTAFRWKDGQREPLGVLAGMRASRAISVSADGRIVVGYCGRKTAPDWQMAFVWDEDHGMRSLSLVAQQYGAALTGHVLLTATGVSADGTVIAGRSRDSRGLNHIYRLQLPSAAFTSRK